MPVSPGVDHRKPLSTGPLCEQGWGCALLALVRALIGSVLLCNSRLIAADQPLPRSAPAGGGQVTGLHGSPGFPESRLGLPVRFDLPLGVMTAAQKGKVTLLLSHS